MVVFLTITEVTLAIPLASKLKAGQTEKVNQGRNFLSCVSSPQGWGSPSYTPLPAFLNSLQFSAFCTAPLPEPTPALLCPPTPFTDGPDPESCHQPHVWGPLPSEEEALHFL